MGKFFLRRFLATIPKFLALTLVVFLLSYLLPGDFFSQFEWPHTGVSPEAIRFRREALGLYDPWYIQYINWLGRVLQGDFGRSTRFLEPVTDVVGRHMYNTFTIIGFATIFTYLIAIPLGMVSGRHKETIRSRLITMYSYVGFSLPLFIFAILVLWLFGFHLGWIPTSGSVAIGMEPGGMDYVWSRIQHGVPPALTLAVLSTGAMIQYLRNEMVEAEQQLYTATARAKGASENRVYYRHAFRNSLIPLASSSGLDVVALIGTTTFVEMIFSYPGLGQLLFTSIQARDHAVVVVIVLIYGILAIIGALIGDVLLMLVDPRVRVK